MPGDTFASSVYVTETGTDGGVAFVILRYERKRRIGRPIHEGLLQVGAPGGSGRIVVKDSKGAEVLTFSSEEADLYIGGGPNGGDILGIDANRVTRFRLNANEATIQLFDASGRPFAWAGATLHNAEIALGGDGHSPGRLALRSGVYQDRITLDAKKSEVLVRTQSGAQAMRVIPVQFPPSAQGAPGGARANLFLGGPAESGQQGVEGYLACSNRYGKDTCVLRGNSAQLELGADGVGGRVTLNNDRGTAGAGLTWNELSLGRVAVKGDSGTISLKDGANKERVLIDGAQGDVKLFGGDCAEEFEVEDAERPEPGTVMVIREGGKLRPCDEPYDRRVAGVVSGGHGIHPGITLNNRSEDGRVPVALAGTVFCKVDAQYDAIDTGDLLTTSATVGCAMKTSDPARAFGAVIGKALAPLPKGRDVVPVLVALH